ncbi:MAG: T9SS type A sorting domain-containing protein [Bacteroidales bacterium]|nr:T9SS type A sorting domain-containing protein [Bacteroidales bacterium]
MKKLIIRFHIIIIIFFTSHNICIGQAYHPFPDSNAVWSVLEFTGFYPDSTQYQTKLYGLIDDTIINTINYNKLYYNDGLIDSTIQIASSNTSYLCAIRQDTLLRKVYFIPKDSINELILYDFNINVGDTFFVYNELGYEVKAWCIGIDMLLVDGVMKRAFSIKTYNTPFSFHTLFEGIGNMRGLFKNFNMVDNATVLKCLTINDTVHYKFDGNYLWGIFIDTAYFNTCYHKGVIIYTKINYYDNNYSVEINPNPFTFSTKIIFSDFKDLKETIIDVYDIRGYSVMQFNALQHNEIELHRSDFKSSGLYFIRIQHEKSLKTLKLLVY